MFHLVEDICKDDNLEELAKQVDVIFTATPQGFLAGLLTEEILSQVKIVDLSADYRIKDVATYEKWYGIEHKAPQFIDAPRPAPEVPDFASIIMVDGSISPSLISG